MIQRFEEFNRNITEAYKAILKIKAYEMQKFGLRAANVMCLFFLGKHPEGLTPSQLCALCGEDKAGISKSLAALKKQALVCAAAGGRKYRIQYTITPAGQAIYEKLRTFIVSAVTRAGDGLSEQERTAFYESLGKIVSNLQTFSAGLSAEPERI